MLVRPLTRPLVRPLTRRVTEPGFGWSPRALFANGEQGAWYDPSDLSTLYQDSAGTTPVTALGQPVGLMLDKSGRGNHASQPTSTSRPTLQARVNLLTQTEDFAHAAWEKLSAGSATAPVLTAGFGAAPDGSLTAARLQAARTGNSTADYSLLQQTGAASTLLHCGSVWAKSNTGVDQTIYFRIADVPSTALVTTEWQRIQVQGTPVSASYFTLGVRGGSGQTDVDILIWHPQRELGDTPTTYQRVTSATDYADVGAKRYLQFDGVDDSMISPAFLGGASDHLIAVGMRFLGSAVSWQGVAEWSASPPSVAGLVGLGRNASTANSTVRLDTADSPTTGHNQYASEVGELSFNGANHVLSVSARTSANQLSLRVDGAAAVTKGLVGPLPDFSAMSRPIRIAKGVGYPGYANIRLYSFICMFSPTAISQAQIEAAERFVNSKTGAY